MFNNDKNDDDDDDDDDNVEDKDETGDDAFPIFSVILSNISHYVLIVVLSYGEASVEMVELGCIQIFVFIIIIIIIIMIPASGIKN